MRAILLLSDLNEHALKESWFNYPDDETDDVYGKHSIEKVVGHAIVLVDVQYPQKDDCKEQVGQLTVRIVEELSDGGRHLNYYYNK